MIKPIIGDQLIDLCRSAKSDIFLAAPFIKHDTLKKIFDVIPENVVNVIIVSRWIPEEIAIGVNDLEIFELIRNRSFVLLLHPTLHAKLYRVDNNCYLGSANITDRAMGWSWQPNIELMVEIPASEKNVSELEEYLLLNSLKANQSIHDAMKLEVERLMDSNNEIKKFKDSLIPDKWLPVCLKPSLLYKIYIKGDTSGIVQSLIECGERDLFYLKPPGGLSEDDFRQYISILLAKHPIAVRIEELSLHGTLNTDHGSLIVQSYCEPDFRAPYDMAIHWEIIKSWLMYYFPNKYRVKVIEEVLEQARTIS